MEPVRFASFAGAGNFAQKSVLNDELARAIGQKVLVDGSVQGTLKFYGKTSFAKGVWCGVEVPSGGKNDGSVNGVYYFRCPPGCGKFVAPSKILLVKGGPKAGGNQTPPRNPSPTPSSSAPAKLSAVSRLRPPSVQKPTMKTSPPRTENTPPKTSGNSEQHSDESGATPIKSTVRIPIKTANQSKVANGASSLISAPKSESVVGDVAAMGRKSESGISAQAGSTKDAKEERVSKSVTVQGRVSVGGEPTTAGEKKISRLAKPSTPATVEQTAVPHEKHTDGAKVETTPQRTASNPQNSEILQEKPQNQESAHQGDLNSTDAKTDDTTPIKPEVLQPKHDVSAVKAPLGQSLPRPAASIPTPITRPSMSMPNTPRKIDQNPTQKPEIQVPPSNIPAPRVSPKIPLQLRAPQAMVIDKSRETAEKSRETPNSGLAAGGQTLSGSRIPRPTPLRERLSFASFVSSAVAAITSGFGGGEGNSEENLQKIGQDEPGQPKDANPPVVAEEVLWKRPTQAHPITPPESMKSGKPELDFESPTFAAPKSVEGPAAVGQSPKAVAAKMENPPPKSDPKKLLSRGPSTPTRAFNQSQDSLFSTRGTNDGRSPTPSIGGTEELMFTQVETICQLQDELEQSQGRLGPLKNALECTASEAESATNRMHELETRLAETETLLAACREQIRDLEVSNEKERRKNEEELMRTTENWKQQEPRSDGKQTQLVVQNKQHGEERQSLDTVIRRLESQNSTTLLAHAQELETLRRQLLQAISDRSSLESAMRTELAAMTQRHEDEVRCIRADHRDKLQAVLKQRQPGEVGLLKDRIAELEGIVESLKFENERLTSASKTVGVAGDKSTDTAHLQAEIESLTTVYELKKQECKALQAKAEQMEAMEVECRALKGKVKAMTNRIEELEDSLGSRKDAEWEARQQVAKVQGLLYQKEDSERRLSDQNKVLRMQLKDMQTPRKQSTAGPGI